MTCDVCGARGARTRKTTRTFGSGRSTFLIEGLPLVHCSSCGESYFTAATLKAIEHIRRNWREMTVAKRMPVAKFRGAA
jgi:YgiT-type zinc finger domain-containing protein